MRLNWPWVDSVFHPAVAHVERFGKFLAHFGIDDALGVVGVGFERGSGDWLIVAEFTCGRNTTGGRAQKQETSD
jgi:hypothetical protein